MVCKARKETMRMEDKALYVNKKVKSRKKNKLGNIRTFIVLSLFLLSLCSCGSTEAVLLESDELVYEKADENEPESELLQEVTEQTEVISLFVHICGAVQSPGVYELTEGSRIFDAVEAAGGFRQDAYENYVNMALPLKDGWKIVIPTIEESEALLNEGAVGGAEPKPVITSEKEGIYEGETAAGTVTDDGRVGLVNINTASKEELCTLPGIGMSRADSILSYRESHNGFTSLEDIMQVEGIKEGMFSKLKDKICIE